ncbi:MAG: Lambda phage tail fiber protein [Cyanobacteriota bacterium]|jgi:predicted phage tail protein
MGFANRALSKNPITDPITATSNDYVKLLLAIGEGELEGMTSLSDIYFDKTPLINSDGSANFLDVSVDYSIGGSNQSNNSFVTNLNISNSNVNTVNVEIKNIGNGTTRQISNADITGIKVRLSLQMQYNDKNGDVRRTDCCFKILIKEGNGAFVERYSTCINARYVDPVTFEYYFPVDPTQSSFQVRVQKTVPNEPPSPDNRESKESVSLKWLDYFEINNDRILYTNTALLALQFPSKTFQSIPEIWMKLGGIKCRIPSNATVNATDRGTDFSGSWNGNFYLPTKATADPAWIVYYLLTEPRFKLGIPEEYIDKFALYQCSVYNNGYVDNGYGGLERRFLFNTVLGTGGQEVVIEMIRAICSTMYAKPYWNGTQLSFWQDRPTTALPKILTNADVEDGKFAYQTKELNTVTTVAKVSYQSTIEDWEQISEIVEDPASIDKYGVQIEEYALLGETRRGAAIRSGRRTIFSSLPNNIFLTCKVRARAMFFQPGDVIQVSDSAKNKVRIGGLVSAVTTTKVTLDAPVTLTSNTNKKIYLTLPDETVIERTITNGAGTFTEINLSTPLTTLPQIQSPWQIIDTTNKVQLYRVTDVVPDSENKSLFEITAKTYG